MLKKENARTSVAGLCLVAFTSTVAFAQTAEQKPLEPQEDYVVSASRIRLKASEVGSSVTVITAEEIEQRGDRYVSDVLRDVPGLAVNRTGSYGALTQIRIRGAEGNHTLVVIDGVEVNNPASGSEFNFGSLLLNNIDRIEVLRGSQSALWGSDAIGGVINIITKNGAGLDGLSSYASVSAGSYRTAEVNAGLSGGKNGYSFSLDASRFTTDGISQADKDNGNTEKDGQDITAASGSFTLSAIENLTVSLTGRYSKSFLETDAFTGGVGAVDADKDSAVDRRYGRLNIKYDLFGGDWSHRASISYGNEDSVSRTNKVQSYASEGDKLKLDYETTIRFGTAGDFPAKHAVTLLMEREDESIQTTSITGSKSIINNSIAGEYNLNLFDNLSVSLSGRLDFNDRFQNARTFRTTASYNFTDTGTRLHTSYGTGVKNPTLTELFGYSGTFVGNANLTPEGSKSWDMGIAQTLWDDRLDLDVTYFNSTITDLISGAGNTSVNLSGQSPAQGVEFALEAELSDNLGLRASYTYTNATTATGAQQVRRPRHVASANLNYQFLEDRAQVNLGVDFTGKQKDFEFDASYNRTLVDLKAYALVNLKASYDVTDTLQVFVRGENLLNQNYQEVLTYGTPGISTFIGMTARF